MSYRENMYNWLKKNGYADKYEHPGINCIKIDQILVYIGKSQNMLKRIAEHYVAIKQPFGKKYDILAETWKSGHAINFDVLYIARSTHPKEIKEELGKREGELIREYKPILNTQIPKADNWRKYEKNELIHSITLAEILMTKGEYKNGIV